MTGGQELASFQQATLDERMRYANAIAHAGNLVPMGLRDQNGGMNPGKVMMVMEQAIALGFHPMVGVNNINVIDGKLSLSPAMMQAAIRKAGHTLRIEKVGTIENGDYAVTAVLIRSDDPDFEFKTTWTPHRAARAGLCTYDLDVRSNIWMVRASSRSGKVLPWQAYTEAMCKARAISEVCMEGATDVLMGAYTPEELGAEVNEAGEAIRLEGDPYEADAVVAEVETKGGSYAPNASEVIDADVEPGDVAEWEARIVDATTVEDTRALWFAAQEAGQFAVMIGEVTLREAIERKGSLLGQQEAAGVIQEQLAGEEIDGNTPTTPLDGAETAENGVEVPQEGVTAPTATEADSEAARAAAEKSDAEWFGTETAKA